MKKLLFYMKDYRRDAVLGPLFKLLEALMELLVPLAVAAIVDTGIGNGDRSYIIKMCLVLAGLGFAGLLLSVTAQYFAAKASVGFVKKIRHALFSHIQRLSYTELDRLGVSAIITRMTSDMNQVQSGVNLTLRLLLRSPFVVFGAMIMAFTVDVRSAWIFAAVIPLLSLIVFGIMLLTVPLYKKVQKQLDRVLNKTRENLTGIRVIRAFCREDREISAYNGETECLSFLQKHVGRISALMNPLTYVVINLAILLLIRRGALQVEAGLLTQGAVIALYNYMAQILTELIKFANLIIQITKAVASGNRIQEVFETVSSASRPNGMPTLSVKGPAVEFKNVSFRYQGAGAPSLQDISFSVHIGETVGIIGGTGAGKTTLVNLIPRFYETEQGEVRVNGADVKMIPENVLRTRIAVVPQKAVLFRGTVRENMLWGKENATDEEIWQALETAQAAEIVRDKENGLDFLIEENGRNLSGGQRQRLTIARALVKKPEILILDDSASALDFATEASLRRALHAASKNAAVFIVSQRASSIQHADQILVLENGRLVGKGRHEELLASCSVYREIYDSQFKKEETA